ncbi:MAG: hypothetical protein IKJ99_03645 [Oscillospiraceae bacterium]|nr:hypothetical protein [Oscillospiraceae bacterium]
MERLTKVDFVDAPVTYRGCDLVGDLRLLGYKTIAVYVDEVLKKLSEYEDSGLTPAEVASIARLKAAGRLIEQPVAVGDIVWEIRTNYPKSKFSYKRYDFAIHTNPRRLQLAPNTCYTQSKRCTKSDMKFIGRTIFLTEEEALNAIKEAQKNARCIATE